MARKEREDRPQTGRRVWLGGRIVSVIDAIHGFPRVTVKLDNAADPVTIAWIEADDFSIVYPGEHDSRADQVG